jgi:hypothetical protein
MNDKGENNYFYTECSGYVDFNPDLFCSDINKSKAFPFDP